MKNKQKGMSGFTIKPELLSEVDNIRKDFPRSRLISKALQRYIEDVKNKKINVLGEPLPEK